MEFVSKSDVGKKRTNNEDSMYAKVYNDDVALFVVADGLGGYKSGEVASKIVVDIMSSFIEENINIILAKSNDDIKAILNEALNMANDKIYKLEKTDEKYNNMGTTIVTLLKVKDTLFSLSVGDTRMYHIDLGLNDIKQLTVDDTYVNELLKTNVITKEQAKIHPQKHVLTKAIGVFKTLEVEVKILDETEGYFILCSDGLTNMLSDSEILNCVKKTEFSNVAVKLVDLANEKGGNDNITVILTKKESK